MSTSYPSAKVAVTIQEPVTYQAIPMSTPPQSIATVATTMEPSIVPTTPGASDAGFLVTESGGIQNPRFSESISDDQKLFATVFPHIRTELVTCTFTCALEKDVLWHGKLFFTVGHLCFYSKLFTKVAKVCKAWTDVLRVEKRNTAGVFPNAIRVSTLHSKFVFTSFIKRDFVYTKLRKQWKQVNSDDLAVLDTDYDSDSSKLSRTNSKMSEYQVSGILTTPSMNDAAGDSDIDDTSMPPNNTPQLGLHKNSSETTLNPDSNENLSIEMLTGQLSADEAAFGVSLAVDEKNSATSLLLSGESPKSSPRTNAALNRRSFTMPSRLKQHYVNSAETSTDSLPQVLAIPSAPVSCDCPQHHKHKVTDKVLQGLTPQQYFNIQFSKAGSSFMTTLYKQRGSTEYKFVEWEGSSRTVIYDLQFKAPMMSPQNTKCIEKQTIIRDDPYVKSVEACVKTPGVPYGESFEVITRYCITFETPTSVRFVSTSKINFLKKVMWERAIESGAVDGCTGFAKDLIAAVTDKVSKHPEFCMSSTQVESVMDEPAMEVQSAEAETLLSPMKLNSELPPRPVEQYGKMFWVLIAALCLAIFSVAVTKSKRASVYERVDALAAEVGIDRDHMLDILRRSAYPNAEDAIDVEMDRMLYLVDHLKQ